jgi:hypothetical protein
LDIQQGYNNILIKEGDQWKAVFKTKFGFFEPLVMFFGLCNSPSTFQEMMNVIYKMVIAFWEAKGTIIHIYMDNIAIATSGSREDHIQAVQDMLRVAKEHDLYFKPEKCVFHAPSIDYLGVIIEKGMTRMDPVKIAGIKNWPIPTNVTVSPSPQPQDDTDEKLHVLRKYARDFRRRHTKGAQDFDWGLDDEDHGLAIGCLVVT